MRYLLFFLICFGLNAYSQSSDSLSLNTTIAKSSKLKNHSPSTAAIMSGLFPGLGQIYNQKYWKAPIVWGGLAAFGYLWVGENNRYQDAKTSYLTYVDDIKGNEIPYNGSSNVDIIQQYKNIYRNQRDMYLLFGILFYGLNIADAAVDAHLMKFDVSDDLSMNINLDMKSYPQRANVPSLCFNFNLK